MEKRKIPGLQLAVVQHGRIIKTGNYGLANVQDSIPVTDKSVFTINSVTKAFTGIAILQLMEAGKLKLSDTLGSYLWDIPDSWKKVTILQLLSHTSGIPHIVNEVESILIASEPDEAWKKVITLPIDFEPGEEFRYNQTNYLLLGHVIDKLSGMSFRDYIVKEQLRKAGMPLTIKAGFGDTKSVITNAAGGYHYTNGKLNNMLFSLPPELQTASGMSSTAAEMANWIMALQTGKLLKKSSSLKILFEPVLLNNGKTDGFSNQINGYGVGWPIASRINHPAGAAVGGGRAAVFVYYKDDLAIVVLTNLAGGSPELFIDEYTKWECLRNFFRMWFKM